VKQTDGQETQRKVSTRCDWIVNNALRSEVTLKEGCDRVR